MQSPSPPPVHPPSSIPVAAYVPPPHAGLDLLYADEWLLVVNKPCGLLSVPGRGEDKADCLLSRVQAEFPDALIVHRLDRDTSGLLVLARGKKIHRELSILFAERKVEKRYIALLAGRLEKTEGSVDLPLIVDWPNRPRQKICHVEGRPSLTHFQLLSYDPATDTSRVALVPHTGRSHQLRVHMLSLGHPILGDDLYGPPPSVPRLMLHAEMLGFCHPVSGEFLRFERAPEF